MAQSAASQALAAEGAALTATVASLAPGDLALASPCPPWTTGQLLGHILIGADRIAPALAAAARLADGAAPVTRLGLPSGTPAPISPAAYYRPDHRFSAAVNSDRIDAAITLAASLPTVPELHAELARRHSESLDLLTAAPADAVAMTRHGDLMLLTDFAVTRVAELGLHGLDLAIGLNRQPWLTGAAAAVLEDLLLPSGHAARLAERLRCDRIGLIAMLTGRAPQPPAAAAEFAAAGAVRLSLG